MMQMDENTLGIVEARWENTMPEEALIVWWDISVHPTGGIWLHHGIQQHGHVVRADKKWEQLDRIHIGYHYPGKVPSKREDVMFSRGYLMEFEKERQA